MSATSPPDDTPPTPDKSRQPKGCLSLLGNLAGQSEFSALGLTIKAPLGILLTALLSIIIAYLLILMIVIPKKVYLLSEPIIEASLTAQPTAIPKRHLVVQGKTLQNKQICVVPGETVSIRIEPEPDGANSEYLWLASGATAQATTNFWEREIDFPATRDTLGNFTGGVVTVNVCESDPDTGMCGRAIDFMIFTVQETCPK